MNEYKTFIEKLARDAGAILLEKFHQGVTREYKKDASPVTEADHAVNDLVLERIKEAYPEHSIIAEEGSALKDGAEYLWVCDPLDGTLPFSHSVPTFVFSLALVRDGQPIAGVLFDPVVDRLIFAEKGKGAFLNGKETKVLQKKEFQQGLFHTDGIDQGWRSKRNIDIGRFRDALYERNVWMYRLGSSAYSGLLTASGELFGVAAFAGNAYDYAALKIVVEEAGGVVTDVYGNEQRYDQDVQGIVATNGFIHDEVIALLHNK